MDTKLPEKADARQLRVQAKELLRLIKSGDPAALAEVASLDSSLDPEHARLSDAQRLIARKYGFTSWPKMVEEVETPELLQRVRRSIELGQANELDALLKRRKSLRGHLNDPLFSFDQPPIIPAARHPNGRALVRTLVRYGADPNARSGWWAGGFTALDYTNDEVTEELLRLGARFDVWSAAAQGRADVLAGLLDANPDLVNAPGGDGKRPLHFAANAEIARLLIERGADLNVRDVDHESTPAQYQVLNLEVLKLLAASGATMDVFTAVMLDDADMVRHILKSDASASSSRVGAGDFRTKDSNGGHIYDYQLGPNLSPMLVAAKFGKGAAFHALAEQAEPSELLVAYAWREDEAAFRALLTKHPQALMDLPKERARAIADAAQAGKEATVQLLLEAGIDPAAPGMSQGTALHVAAWFGWPRIVDLLIPHVPLETRDPVHGSTVLGWALHGAQWCANNRGDYPATVEKLLAAGAEVSVPAHSGGGSMLGQAGSREDVKAVLRRYGA